MSNTKIIKSRPSRGKFAVKGGRYISVSIDARTHAALLHAIEAVRYALGTTANQSTVVRAAVSMFVSHIDKVAAKLLEPVPPGQAAAARPHDPADESLAASQMRLLGRERRRIKDANEGAEVPFVTMPAYVPGKPFADVLATGWRHKRYAMGSLGDVQDPVRDLLDREAEREATSGKETNHG